MMSKRPNVLRSHGWDPGYHEENRNGPDSYKESPVSELGNDSGVFTGNVLEGSGRSGTPEGKGT